MVQETVIISSFKTFIMVTNLKHRLIRHSFLLPVFFNTLITVLIVSCNNGAPNSAIGKDTSATTTKDSSSVKPPKKLPDFWVQYKLTFNNSLTYKNRLTDTAKLGNFFRNYISKFNQNHGANLNPVFAWTIADSSHFTVKVNLSKGSQSNLNNIMILTADSTTTPNCPKPPPTYFDVSIDAACWQFYSDNNM